jgi:hypothetical protein
MADHYRSAPADGWSCAVDHLALPGGETVMADIEKVKRGLAYCADGCSTDCPYTHDCRCGKNLSIDSMTVIEELQAEIERLQPKKGKWIFTGQKNAYGGTVIQCPFCDDKYAAHNPSDEHFCRNCGAKLTD